jgi:hypothetical protein
MNQVTEIPDAIVDTALAEYRLSLSTNRCNTAELRDRPGTIERLQRAAMRDALQAAFDAVAKHGITASEN